MKYAKPEVVRLGSAIDAVQSVGKQDPMHLETGNNNRKTIPAYEADE